MLQPQTAAEHEEDIRDTSSSSSSSSESESSSSDSDYSSDEESVKVYNIYLFLLFYNPTFFCFLYVKFW